jgi:hypothetical protein
MQQGKLELYCGNADMVALQKWSRRRCKITIENGAHDRGEITLSCDQVVQVLDWLGESPRLIITARNP